VTLLLTTSLSTPAISVPTLAKDVLMADVVELSDGWRKQRHELEAGLGTGCPGTSHAMVQKALDQEPVAIMGPIYSGSVRSTCSSRRMPPSCNLWAPRVPT
jgi:hypothetical protein